MRVDGKVRKQYDINPPFNRLLNSPKVSEEEKNEMLAYKNHSLI